MRWKGTSSSWNHWGRISGGRNKRTLHGTCSWIFAAYTVNIGQQAASFYSPAAFILGGILAWILLHFLRAMLSQKSMHLLLSPHQPPTLTFCWLSMIVICTENVNIHEFRVAYKFKCDLTHLLQGVHSQSTLLQELPAQEKTSYMKLSIRRTKIQSLALLTHSKPFQWTKGESSYSTTEQGSDLHQAGRLQHHSGASLGGIVCYFRLLSLAGEQPMLEGEDSGKWII